MGQEHNDGYNQGRYGGALPPNASREALNGYLAGESAKRYWDNQAAQNASNAASYSWSSPSSMSSSGTYSGKAYSGPYVPRKPLGPVAYGVIGSILGVLVEQFVRGRQHHSFMSFPSETLYLLCFVVSFGSLFFAAKQLLRHKWVSAGVAIALGYGLTQLMRPGFNLPSILRACL